MENLINKLSSYNLFNYLLPGIIFVVLLNKTTNFSLIQSDVIIGFFVYYFIGLIISRFGSLIIEPLLRRLSFLKFANYKDFVTVSKIDDKLEILSETNNTYRSLISLFTLLLILKMYIAIANKLPFLKELDLTIFVTSLLIMFLFSYRKQTQYITKRIEANLEAENK